MLKYELLVSNAASCNVQNVLQTPSDKTIVDFKLSLLYRIDDLGPLTAMRGYISCLQNKSKELTLSCD